MGSSTFFAATDELSRVQNTFSIDGQDTDPVVVTLTITSPSGVSTTYDYPTDISRSGPGAYYLDVDVSSDAGTWQYDWVGQGIVDDHETGTWEVLDTQLGKLYAPITSLKSRLGITDTVDDLELHGAIFAASRSIEQACERHFYRQAAVRTFLPDAWPDGLYRFCLPDFSDLVSVTTLATDASGDGDYETVWDATDFQLLPQNAATYAEPWPYTEARAIGPKTFPVLIRWSLQRRDLIQIDGVFGWPKVPQAIRQATLIAATELFKLKDAPFGVAGFGDFGPVRIRDNPVVARLIQPYMRHAFLAR